MSSIIFSNIESSFKIVHINSNIYDYCKIQIIQLRHSRPVKKRDDKFCINDAFRMECIICRKDQTTSFLWQQSIRKYFHPVIALLYLGNKTQLKRRTEPTQDYILWYNVPTASFSLLMGWQIVGKTSLISLKFGFKVKH